MSNTIKVCDELKERKINCILLQILIHKHLNLAQHQKIEFSEY